jgi:hypothetical protein
MLWTEEAKKLIDEIKIFVTNKYKILELDFDIESENYIIHTILIPNRELPLDTADVYIFITLKIYDVIDRHISTHYYFDQIYGDFPIKGPNLETNIFNSDNEIFNIADEFGLKSDEKTIVRQIFGRIRFLASKNIYDFSIANNFSLCKMEYENPIYYENENFKNYFKNYINKHPKYLRYLDLLRKVLVKSYYFRRNIFIPFSKKDLITVLEDPFIWTILEPYNHIL